MRELTTKNSKIKTINIGDICYCKGCSKFRCIVKILERKEVVKYVDQWKVSPLLHKMTYDKQYRKVGVFLSSCIPHLSLLKKLSIEDLLKL